MLPQTIQHLSKVKALSLTGVDVCKMPYRICVIAYIEQALTPDRAIFRGANLLFLEYVKVERLADTAPPEERWFPDLLKRSILAQGPRHGTQRKSLPGKPGYAIGDMEK